MRPIRPLPFLASLALAAGLLGLPLGAAANPAQAPTADVRYVLDPSLPGDQAADIYAAIELARHALPDVGSFVVRAAGAPVASAPCSADIDDYLGHAGSGEIELHTQCSAWAEDTRESRQLTAIHEYYHLVQESLGRIDETELADDEVSAYGPLWLSEGSADYVALVIGSEGGIADYEAGRRQQILDAWHIDGRLRDFESFTGPNTIDDMGQYTLGFVAAEYLARNYSAGDRYLLKYWQGLGEGLSWKSSFQRAFGISISQFYNRFDEYWANLERPRGTRGSSSRG